MAGNPPVAPGMFSRLYPLVIVLLWGTTLNRTYGTYKKLYMSLFLPTIFDPIYYGPP